MIVPSIYPSGSVIWNSSESIIFHYPCNFSYLECFPVNVTLSAGFYKFEVWGAQGGGNPNGSDGGRGGYSKGYYSLSQSSNVYIFIGGKGESSGINSARGGYNGGGSGFLGNEGFINGGGGGATDIRFSYGFDSRVIVAGGGGGGGRSYGEQAESNSSRGGEGGGLSGINGYTYAPYTQSGAGSGGNQTHGGIGGYYSYSSWASDGEFGLGGFGTGGASSSGGGGGGYYGGGGGCASSGGGGSGYIHNLLDSECYSGLDSFLSPNDITECGHPGNGAARITQIYQRAECTFNYDVNIYLRQSIQILFLFSYTIFLSNF